MSNNLVNTIKKTEIYYKQGDRTSKAEISRIITGQKRTERKILNYKYKK